MTCCNSRIFRPFMRPMHMLLSAGVVVMFLGCAQGDVPGGDVADVKPYGAVPQPDTHPSVLYEHAVQELEAGREDSATFWFYAGQLRARVFLGCEESGATDGDEQLLGALFDTVGNTINPVAFADIDGAASIMTDVLDWDLTHPAPYIDYEACSAIHEEVRDGLVEFRQHILDNADDMRRTREENGLANR